jgi:hypothetical protein
MFAEKNGLRHGEFPVPNFLGAKDSSPEILSIDYSPDSNLLALQCE